MFKIIGGKVKIESCKREISYGVYPSSSDCFKYLLSFKIYGKAYTATMIFDELEDCISMTYLNAQERYTREEMDMYDEVMRIVDNEETLDMIRNYYYEFI